MTRHASRRLALAAAAVVVVAALATSAVAYWGGSGHGAAQTRLGDAKALVLGPGAPAAQLYPGGDAAVSVVARNANPYTVHVGVVGLDTTAGTGGFDVDAAHSACDVSPLTFVAQDNGGAGWTVPPRAGGADGVRPIDMANALLMAPTAGNACQGAVFTVHLVVTR
jgi:hypothetical protein